MIDTVGLNDNREDLDLSDELILLKLSALISMYPESTKIYFVMVQALSDSRINIAKEANKYTSIFDNAYLRSSLLLGTKIDMLPNE